MLWQAVEPERLELDPAVEADAALTEEGVAPARFVAAGAGLAGRSA
ncbi:MAG: hypothetical protein IRZ07_22560 [Microbispora sp.]|nr:hypothetical protein [Microbispora sp.]